MSTTEITDPDIAERLDVALNGDTPGDPLHHGCRNHVFDGGCPLCRHDERVTLAGEALDEIRNLRGAMKADDDRLLAATDKVGMPPAGCDTADALADEILRLRAELERMNTLIDKGFSYKELGMKMVNGELRVNAIFDNETEFSPMKFLAAICWAGLHEGDGNEPANYREASVEVKVGTGDGDPIRIALAVVKPYRKSPHELRIVAETLCDRLASTLREPGVFKNRDAALAVYDQAKTGFAS